MMNFDKVFTRPSRNLCDQDKINEDNDERKKDHENVGFYKILILYRKYFLRKFDRLKS